MNNYIPKIWETLKKEKILAWANILIMSITFTILGIFLTLVFISQSTLEHLERQAQVTVFFEDNYDEEHILSLKTQLEQDARIASVEYISKEKALEIFKEINKDEPLLLESVSANILPASLNIKTKQMKDLEPLAEELKQAEGVEGVKFFRDVIDNFQRIANIIYIVGFVLSTIFLFVSYATIVLLLRNYIHRKGQELEVLKLVGASNEYVRKPIIAQGVFFSLIASLIASLGFVTITGILQIVYGDSRRVLVPFSNGLTISAWTYVGAMDALLMLSGLLLGVVGSTGAIKKYLKY